MFPPPGLPAAFALPVAVEDGSQRSLSPGGPKSKRPARLRARAGAVTTTTSPSCTPKHCSMLAGSTHSPSGQAFLAPPMNAQGDEEASFTALAANERPSLLFPVLSALLSALMLDGALWLVSMSCADASCTESSLVDAGSEVLRRGRFEDRPRVSSAGLPTLEEEAEDVDERAPPPPPQPEEA